MELKYWDSMKYLEEQLEKAKRALPGDVSDGEMTEIVAEQVSSSMISDDEPLPVIVQDFVEDEEDFTVSGPVDKDKIETEVVDLMPERRNNSFKLSALQILIIILIGIPIGIPLFGVILIVFSFAASLLIATTAVSAVLALGGLAGGMAGVIFGLVTAFTGNPFGLFFVALGLIAQGLGLLFIFPTRYAAGKGVPASASGLAYVCDKLINVFI